MAATELERVRALVEPIASDLDLELYDIVRMSAVVQITLDTPPGSESGISLDTLSLATRLISREIDHEDPIAGQFTLEVTSPGLERRLRTPRHFQREIGKDITVRLAGHAVREGEDRRIDGKLIDADETTATVLLDSGEERSFPIDGVDKARTVFEWGPAPKPGGTKKKSAAAAPKKEKQES